MADTTDSNFRCPYGSNQRYHLHHVHLFATDIAATIAFFTEWFEGKVIWDGDVVGARNVFMKIGVGALHLYEQNPRGDGRNAIHHIGMQVVGLDELYERMTAAGLSIPNPIRRFDNGGGYFMLGGPDGVLIEVFDPGNSGIPEVQSYYGLE